MATTNPDGMANDEGEELMDDFEDWLIHKIYVYVENGGLCDDDYEKSILADLPSNSGGPDPELFIV